MREHLARISIDPRVMGGKPVIRGTRLTVSFILGQLASGATVDEILAEYEGLSAKDVRACLYDAREVLEPSTGTTEEWLEALLAKPQR